MNVTVLPAERARPAVNKRCGEAWRGGRAGFWAVCRDGATRAWPRPQRPADCALALVPSARRSLEPGSQPPTRSRCRRTLRHYLCVAATCVRGAAAPRRDWAAFERTRMWPRLRTQSQPRRWLVMSWAKFGLFVLVPLWLCCLLDFATDAYKGSNLGFEERAIVLLVSTAVCFAMTPDPDEPLLVGREDPLKRLLTDLSRGTLSLWPAPTAVGNALTWLHIFLSWPLWLHLHWNVVLVLVDGFQNGAPVLIKLLDLHYQPSHLVDSYLVGPLYSLGCAYLSMRIRSYARATLEVSAASRRAEPAAAFTPSGRRVLAPEPAAVSDASVNAELRVLHANALASQAAYDTFIADFKHWARTGEARVTDVRKTVVKRPAIKDEDTLRAARSKSPQPRKAKKVL